MLFKEAPDMATTRLIPLPTGKGRTVGQGIRDIGSVKVYAQI